MITYHQDISPHTLSLHRTRKEPSYRPESQRSKQLTQYTKLHTGYSLQPPSLCTGQTDSTSASTLELYAAGGVSGEGLAGRGDEMDGVRERERDMHRTS